MPTTRSFRGSIMTVADKSKHETNVLMLRQKDSDKKSIIKHIKNSIIGNRTNKQIYISLGLVNSLVQTIGNVEDELKTEIVVVLCSLAHGTQEQVLEITRQGALEPLFSCLNSQTCKKLVEATAKAIRAITQYSINSIKVEWISTLIAKLNLENSNLVVASTCASGNICFRIFVFELLLINSFG